MSGSVPIVTMVMPISLIIASASAHMFISNEFHFGTKSTSLTQTCIYTLASLTSAFLGEERVDFVSLLSDDCTKFWYLCLPALHRIWLTYNDNLFVFESRCLVFAIATKHLFLKRRPTYK